MLALAVAACSFPGPADAELDAAPVNEEPASRHDEDLAPFDVEGFLVGKLDGAFDDMGNRVGVVVLVAVDAETDVEAVFSEIGFPDLEGFSYVPPDHLAEAAERYAASNQMEPLDGDWAAFGLIPRFDDTSTAEWMTTLSGVAGTTVVPVDFEALSNPVPTGWRVVTDLGFRLTSDAVVEAVDAGLVIVEPNSTRLIGFDGQVARSDGSPLTVPEGCCVKLWSFPAGDSLVLIVGMEADTWILDVPSLSWRRADPKPTIGNGYGKHPLGAALIDGEMFVVDAASRRGEAVSSTTEVLDLSTGSWRVAEPVPSPISVGGVTTDGERVIVAGTRQDGNNRIIGDRFPLVYQYTDGDGWSQIASVAIDGQAATVVWVEGTGLLAWNYDLQSALLDPSGSWQALDDVPMSESECYPRSVLTRPGIVGLCGGIAWFEATTTSWNPIPGPSWTRYVVAEDRLIGLLELDRDQTQMIEYPLLPDEQ